MGNLKLKDLYIGKIDSYNEYVEYGSDICKKLYFENPGIDIAKLLNGSVYYICGDKGVGKTMVLKYVESIVADGDISGFTEFVRFKKDIGEDERNGIKRAALPKEPFEEVIESEIPKDSSINCALAWQAYLVKVIIERVEREPYGVFDRNGKEWKELVGLLELMYGQPDKNAPFKTIIPKVKKGNVEIDIAKRAKLNLEFDWLDKNSKTVSFNTLGKKLVNLYSSLTPADKSVYVFVDELELSFKKESKGANKYERDAALIRDLIFAVQYMNEISKKNKYPVFIITALRNEVYRNIRSKGYEINKPINDFGVQLTWQKKGGNIEDHPLLKMLEQRFVLSEQLAGVSSCQNIWDSYFPKTVGRNKLSIYNFILDQTWYRPRDIIRFFSIIQSLVGDRTFIDQEVLDIVRQRYSEESWAEFEEELSASYTSREVEGIRLTLIGIISPFTVSDFTNQLDEKAGTFEEVEELRLSKKMLVQILKDLYDIGIIGNYGERARFSFKGDKDIDPMQPLRIHYPLDRYFQTRRH